MKRPVLPFLAVLGLVCAAFACASASAQVTEVLCKTEEAPCKPANVYPEGTAFKAVNKGSGYGRIEISTSNDTIRCRSVIEGTVGKAAGENLGLSVGKWRLGEWPGEGQTCEGELAAEGENCGTNEARGKVPYSAAAHGPEFGVAGPSWQIRCYIGVFPTLDCTYSGINGLEGLGLGEGLHGKIEEQGTALKFYLGNNHLASSGTCYGGEEPRLAGTYEIVEPSGHMYVTWLAANPTATTEAASSVKASSATLNGKVNPENSATSYWFEYDKTEYKEGETTSHGTKIPLSPASVGSGTSNVSVQQIPTGLSENTTYHYRVVAENEAKEKGYGKDKAFTTLKLPKATTEAASSIKASSATLKGTVNPEGSSTSYWFEYDKTEYKEGETTSHGTKIPIGGESVGSGTSNVSVQQTPTGLGANTTYHYRLIAESQAGKSYGTDKTLKTLKLPKATTEAASEIGTTSAALNATVNPEGSFTTYYFEFDKTKYEGETTHGTKIPVTAKSVGSGTSNVAVHQVPNGLSRSQTYHYRVVATGAGVTVRGEDMTFTTSPEGPSATTVAATHVSGEGATLNATVNPEGSGTSYRFEWATDEEFAASGYGNASNRTSPTTSGSSPKAKQAPPTAWTLPSPRRGRPTSAQSTHIRSNPGSARKKASTRPKRRSPPNCPSSFCSRRASSTSNAPRS
jgi:hypothetical protein